MKMKKNIEIDVELNIDEVVEVFSKNNDPENWEKIRDIIVRIDDDISAVEFSHSLLKRLAKELKPHVSKEDFQEIIDSLKED